MIKNKFLIYMFLIISLISISNAITNITDCQNITVPGEYTLNGSISGNVTDSCIEIISNNVSLDCQGFTINAENYYGIKIYRPSQENSNISVLNCNIKDAIFANLYIINSGDNYFENLNIYNSSNGIHFINNYGNTINNSKLYDNSQLNILLDFQTTNFCENYFFNITDNLERPILYYNNQVSLTDLNNISSIILCNSDNSTISNLNLKSSFLHSDIGIYNVFSDNLSLNNISLENFNFGFYGVVMNNSNLSFIDFKNNKQGLVFEDYSFNNNVFSSIFDSLHDDFIITGQSSNNHFFNNSFLSGETYSVINNSFNSSLFGENIGNYWNDMICYGYELRGSYAVCTNPNNYSIYDGVYDFAPLIDISNDLDDCSKITLPGKYTLLNDIFYDDEERDLNYNACLEILTENVTIDCNGYKISNDNNFYKKQILLSRENFTQTNFKLQNCRIDITDDDNSGILFENVKNNSIINTTFNLSDNYNSNDLGIGLWIVNSSRNFLENVTFNNSTLIFFDESSDNEFFGDRNCDSEFKNVSGMYGLPILYYNHPVNIDTDFGGFSILYLCNADNSNISNLDFSNIQNNGLYGNIISIYNSENINLNNINFINNSILIMEKVHNSNFKNLQYNSGTIYLGVYNSTNSHFENISVAEFNINNFISNVAKNFKFSQSYFFRLSNSYNNIFENFSYNDVENLEISFYDSKSCDNNLSNFYINDGEKIFYSNMSVIKDIWGENYSKIILCDTDNSNISNVLLHRDNEFSKGFSLYFVDNSNFSNITLNSNLSFYLYNSSENNFNDIKVNKSYFGIEAYGSKNNKFENLEIYNVNKFAISGGFYNSSFKNFIINNSLNEGINLMNNNYKFPDIQGENIFENFSILNSKKGITIGIANNLFFNGSFINISEDEINFDYNYWWNGEELCMQNITNVYSNNKNLIYFFNKSQNLDGLVNISTLILCNADNSKVENLDIKNSNGLKIILTDNSSFNNLNIKNNLNNGIELYESFNNTFSNSSISDNQNYDLYYHSLYHSNYLSTNIFYGNYFGDKYKFFTEYYSKYYSQNYQGFMNYSGLGFNVGNYFGDICNYSNISYNQYFICNSPENYSVNIFYKNYNGSGFNVDNFSVISYNPLSKYLLLENMPVMTVDSPLNLSKNNVSSRSINFRANFSEDLYNFSFVNNGNLYDFSNEIENRVINTSIPVYYGSNNLTFYFTDRTGQSNSYLLQFNTSLELDSLINDSDADGINDTQDTIFGNISNVYTNIFNFSIKLNNSNNLSQVFNTSSNVTFQRSNRTFLEFLNNFSINHLNLTNIIVKDNREDNKSQFLVSGLDLADNTKTIYLDLLGNKTIYGSICIKDSDIEDFSQISSGCNSTNETYISNISIIPKTLGQYIFSFTNSSNSTVKISGLSHSGVSQVCTENWQYPINWTNCSSNTQTKIPFDTNSCGTQFLKPTVLSQACGVVIAPNSSSNSGGGGGGSSPSSSSSNDDDNNDFGFYSPSTTNKISVKPTLNFQEKFEVKIGDIVNLFEYFVGVKKVQIKDKNLNVNLVEFDYNFSKKSLDLGNTDIQSGNSEGRSYIIVKNLDLNGGKKTIKLKVNNNLGSVCIKDDNINFISDISSNCQASQEYIVSCDNVVSNGYSCDIQAGYYIISGLKHSGVIEFEKPKVEIVDETAIKTNNDNNSNISNSQQTSDDLTNQENELSDLESSSNNSDENSNNMIYIIVGVLILIIIIIFILVTISKNNKNNFKSAPPIMPPIVYKPMSQQYNLFDLYETKYESLKKYIDENKNKYSKEQLYQTLLDAKYPKEFLDKIFEYEYD